MAWPKLEMGHPFPGLDAQCRCAAVGCLPATRCVHHHIPSGFGPEVLVNWGVFWGYNGVGCPASPGDHRGQEGGNWWGFVS